MRKGLIYTAVAILVLFCFGPAQAVTTYYYETLDLNDMNHNLAYLWGINTGWGASQTIYSATLKFHQIEDWMIEDDTIYVNLLDNGPVGVSAYGDYNPSIPFGNYFQGWASNYFVGTWSDPTVSPPMQKYDVSFSINIPTLYNYSLDHNIAFGIDPDCHYYADKVSFEVETSDPIPEPGTLILLGLGLAGAGIIARKR